DDRALDPALNQTPIETEAGRPRLITAAHRRPPPQQPLQLLLVVGKRALLQQLIGAHRRQPNRAGVHVQADSYPRRLAHGRRPPYVALPGHPRQPTTNAQAPTTLHRRSDTAAHRATAPSCLAEAIADGGRRPRGRRPPRRAYEE